MSDLVQFLRARLDEEHENALRGYLKVPADPAYDGWDKATTAGLPPLVAAHVLRDIDAKRQAVDACAEWLHDSEHGTDPCATAVLSALASTYADHPGYRDDGRP